MTSGSYIGAVSLQVSMFTLMTGKGSTRKLTHAMLIRMRIEYKSTQQIEFSLALGFVTYDLRMI